MNHRQNHQDWRCRTCGALLGVHDGDQLEVHIKSARYTIQGHVQTRCRRCGRYASTTTHRKQRHAA